MPEKVLRNAKLNAKVGKAKSKRAAETDAVSANDKGVRKLDSWTSKELKNRGENSTGKKPEIAERLHALYVMHQYDVESEGGDSDEDEVARSGAQTKEAAK